MVEGWQVNPHHRDLVTAVLTGRAGPQQPRLWRAPHRRGAITRLPVHALSTRANHQDPVTTSHLAGGKPGSVTKARTVKEKRHDTGNEQITRQAYDAATLVGRVTS